MNQRNLPKKHRKNVVSGNWNPNKPQEDSLYPYDYEDMRVPSPTSDYPMSEYDERERSFTPNSQLTTYDYDYAQSELLRVQGLEGSEVVQKLVEEETNLIKTELEDAKIELEEMNRQAMNYKRMYDELMDMQVSFPATLHDYTFVL